MFKKNANIIYTLVLVLFDSVAYYISLFMAYLLRLMAEKVAPVTALSFSLEYFASLWWILAALIFCFAIMGLYHRRAPFWIECGHILKAVILSFIIIFAIVSLGQMSDDVSRLFLCLMWVILPFSVMFFRVVAKKYFLNTAYFKRRTLLIGDSSRLKIVHEAFHNDPFTAMQIVKTVVVDDEITFEKVSKLVTEEKISAAVMVAGTENNSSMGFFSRLHTIIKKMYFVPHSSSLDFTNAETGQILRYQLGYMVVNNSMQSSFNRFLKRVFDLCVAVVISPVVFPLIGILILLVKKDSSGAALFKHERVGKDGRSFYVYKMRSMYKDSKERLAKLLEDPEIREEWEANYKLKNDPRVTKIGSFLRKTSLDELPQFINVFKGEMSFVGPRPVLRDELEKYYKDKAVYYTMATPGITGLWQISGRSDVSYDERVSMDCWYVYNWSLWLDIVILFGTPAAVLARKGAY